MPDTLQHHLDGKLVDAQDGARFDMCNSATGEVIAMANDNEYGLALNLS